MAPKRKRAATAEKAAVPEAPIQPSSRDASGEDTADPILDDVKERKSMDPPAKRTRSSTSGRRTDSISSQAKENGAGATVNEAGVHGEAGSMRMEAPPKAGLVDPVGYHTKPPPAGRPVRVYADGVFDLFHLGHMRQLQQAKTAFPDTYLIVGVTGDAETHKRKGLTVLSGKERAESVRHCKWVDEVVEDCPWIIDVAFIEKHKIDYVAHDDIPYGASEGDDIYAPIKKRGQFLVTQRTEGVSTTGIITKIVRDYEQYIARQLKRGTSRQELNISWLKKNEMDIKRHVNELRDNIRQNWTSTGRELSKELRSIWQSSRQNSPAPSTRNGGTPRRVKSPLLDRLNPLDTSSGSGSGSGRSLTPSGRSNADFAAGYAMGLIGGVKGWMQGSKRKNLSSDSRVQSPSGSDDESPAKSPTSDILDGQRGRSLLKDDVEVVKGRSGDEEEDVGGEGEGEGEEEMDTKSS